MAGNIFSSSLKYITIDLAGDLLYWPIWWYSKGLLKAAKICLNEITDQQERLGLLVWIKNISTPMFGQYDLEGRIISFFVRLIQIIVRFFLLLIWSILILVLFLIWLIFPVIIVYEIGDNFLWLFK